jgi:hypothetical protein
MDYWPAYLVFIIVVVLAIIYTDKDFFGLQIVV